MKEEIVEQLDPIRVDFSVPEIYLSKLALNQSVIVTTNAYPKQTFNENCNLSIKKKEGFY